MIAIPVLPERVPRRGSRILRFLGRTALAGLGWCLDGNFPNLAKFVVIAAPHSSNWDFVIGLSAALAVDIDAHWIGKHTIFRWPFGGLMRRLGGIPVDREKSVGLVPHIVGEIRSHEQFVVAIAPEGTRKLVGQWKSGFYHIAVQSGVPVVCAYFDYPTRTVGIGPILHPTGNQESDMEEIRAFYSPFRGRSYAGEASDQAHRSNS